MLCQELNGSKDKLLKLDDEQGQWEKERAFIIDKIYVLNENQLVLEKEREEKERNKHVETCHPSRNVSTEAIAQAMSQVSLRDEEKKSLKT